jgi:hypothetical protein
MVILTFVFFNAFLGISKNILKDDVKIMMILYGKESAKYVT